MMRPNPPATNAATRRRAFSLIEILVVVGIIAVLVAILLPVLEKAKEQSALTICGTNLHGISTALHTYASEYGDAIPRGPATPSSIDPARSWNQLGDATTWIAASAQSTGLGLLTKGYVENPKSLLCPIDDDKNFAATFYANLASTTTNARGSYMYRQLDQTSKDHINDLGTNSFNNPAHAIVMDWQSRGTGDYLHTNHDQNEKLNVLYSDGHVQPFSDQEKAFAAHAPDFASFPTSWTHRIDQTWITADWSETGDPAKAPQLP